MHLGDYHELLVTNRIWTEAPHIEQRLTDLTEHMENVIQKYLRNEFETIEEYNTMAGEVAEPFRILVVANFPTNFNDAALRRLISIVNSGARCGVYALVMLDTKLRLPSGFQLKELENPCVNMIWKDKPAATGASRISAGIPLALDAPPDPGRFSEILHKVGDAARDANRVEVPFEFIAPKPEQYWTFDSSKGVDIPLGRAGATKLQHLKLGKGTSQHVLTAGKTGSGKSTLLHALITNGALRYSPDELELYLIDFKKGVEFKVYAAMELPHARVIAVESEREFGLSVLQRLDVELKERGEIYRAARAARTWTAIARPGPRSADAARPADRRRVPGVLRRGRQDRAGGHAAAGSPGAAGPCLRHARASSARRPWAASTRCPRPRWARWPCGSPCSAARPTPT